MGKHRQTHEPDPEETTPFLPPIEPGTDPFTLKDLVQPMEPLRIGSPPDPDSMTAFPAIEPSDRLVYVAPGVDPEPSTPTNPDLWADEQLDPGEEHDRNRSRRAALGAVLLSAVGATAIGLFAWMFGVSSASGSSPSTVYHTVEREVTATVTEPVTKIKKEVVTRTVRPAPMPVPTVMVTKTLPARPAPTITKTVTQRVTVPPVRITVTATVTEEVEVPQDVPGEETGDQGS